MIDFIKRILQQGTEAAAELIIAVMIFAWYIRHIINGGTQ